MIDVAQATNEELFKAKNDKRLTDAQYYAIQAEIQRRVDEHKEAEAAKVAALPFNPKTDVSADAKHVAGQVVKHLWIIFVLLPVVLAILYSLLK